MTTIAQLAARQCKPLKGNAHRLGAEDAATLLSALPGWDLVDDGAAIRKSFKFKDYYQTMAFVNAVAYLAHGQDHHPDLGVYYDHAVVRYSTHDVGGLSDNDFICAAKVQQLA